MALSFHLPWIGKSRTSSKPSFLLSTSADEDWRAFRARLVMMMNDTTLSTSTFLDDHKHTFMPPPGLSYSWVYDAGLLIEKGSIVLSRIEDVACPDLEQPYLGKCVVLIVEHNPDETTQGIILNRPSDLRLDSQGNIRFCSHRKQEDETYFTVHLDEFEDEVARIRKREEWRMFFGGEIGTLQDGYDMEDNGNHEDKETTIVCLHNISSPTAQQVSDEILTGVYMTSHAAARSLVASGEALPENFYLFYGFCEWDPEQLQAEVQQGSWYVASTDPKTLWDDLARLRDDTYDTRSSGVERWEHLIYKLGKSHEVAEDSAGKDEFSDLMLKEWVTQTLTAISEQSSDSPGVDDASIYRALNAADQPSIWAGRLLRGSNLSVSPYLFHDHFLHKSTVLILHDDDEASIGITLNLPTLETYTVQINNMTSAAFPIRYGGPTSIAPWSDNSDNDIKGLSPMLQQNDERSQQSMVWLHCSAGLKYLRTGKPLVPGDENGVWTCTLEQVIQVIDLGFAATDDFMVVKGFCLWNKEAGSGGVLGQVMTGNLEVISLEQIDGVWTTLRRQTTPGDESSFQENLNLATEAWYRASGEESSEQYNSRCVFESPVTVEELADEALSTWISVHLLHGAAGDDAENEPDRE